MCDTELGDGWFPAVFETYQELEFVRAGQFGWSNSRNYYIGGSANPRRVGVFHYHLYDITECGKNLVGVAQEMNRQRSTYSTTIYMMLPTVPRNLGGVELEINSLDVCILHYDLNDITECGKKFSRCGTRGEF